MIKSESLIKLAPALVAAQKKMGVAIKDAKNPFFKSNFADLNSVIEASVPVFNGEGIAVLQTPAISESGKTVIQTILLHESGEFLTSETEVVCAKANDPQALGSAISYARRYGLQATATLRAVDDDSEAAMGRATKTEARAVPRAVIPDTINTPAAAETVTETPKRVSKFKRQSLPTATAEPATMAEMTGDVL